MKTLLIASLVLPFSALAASPFTGNHPEESLPDNAQQVSSDPYQPLVRQVQERLHQLGFDAGPVNGEFSEKTQAALAQFQLSLVIPASGQLDERTLSELGIAQAAPEMDVSPSAGGSQPPTTEGQSASGNVISSDRTAEPKSDR